MAARPSVALALLAAGRSSRFGREDKLAAAFRGKPLWRHAAQTLRTLPLAHRWLIVRQPGQFIAEGYTGIVNTHADQGIGASVALAAALAQEAGADALLIALADMPLVPASHFARLVEAAGPDTLLASHNGSAPSPPALFGREHFAGLQKASGDKGARALLRAAGILRCDPALMIDIDTPEALLRHG